MSNINHNVILNQFTLDIRGYQTRVEYKLKDNLMYLTYAEVPVTLRGYGIGKELVLQTFERLTNEGYKAVAVCSYIKSIANKSEKWKSIIG